MPFLSAPVDQGMGSYAVAPGTIVTTDASSWATTYTAQAQYTVATGP